jgi:hypothetical protein
MTKLPAKLETRAGSVNARIAKLRAATGRPERLERSLRCSRTGHGFSVVFERLDPGLPFKLASVVKEQAKKGSAISLHTQQPEHTYPAHMIDTTGLACPWCSAGGMVFHRACKTLWCDGAECKTADGAGEFTCPQCEVSFRLTEAREIGMRDAREQSASSKLLGSAASLLKLGRARD